MTFSRKSTDLERRALALLEDRKERENFLHQFLTALSPEAQQGFIQILDERVKKTSSASSTFAKALGARQLDSSDQKALELATLVNFFDYRRSLLANAIPATTLAKMLGVSRQTVHERFRSGQLLGALDSNVLKFPDWQFDANGPSGVVQGLAEVLAVLKCSDIAKISWLASANPVFGHERPIEILKRGQIEEVLKEARAVELN
ncbi:MAG: hypothetical protein KGS72_26835 [Cyanobacteria bacterium REEB67]|nr:hypothetical protein [Cyanobacteria bacterium REEB67]